MYGDMGNTFASPQSMAPKGQPRSMAVGGPNGAKSRHTEYAPSAPTREPSRLNAVIRGRRPHRIHTYTRFSVHISRQTRKTSAAQVAHQGRFKREGLSASASPPTCHTPTRATRAAAFGADENYAQDAGFLFQSVWKEKERLECVVLLVRHTNKAGIKRGSSAFRGKIGSVLDIAR